MNNHIDELMKKYKAMPGSKACLVVADQLEEMGDPNYEIVRDSLLVEMDICDGRFDYGRGLGNGGGSGFGYGSGFGFGRGFGDGHGESFADGEGQNLSGGNGEGSGDGSGYAGSFGSGFGDDDGGCDSTKEESHE